jgi:hypothetical protein
LKITVGRLDLKKLHGEKHHLAIHSSGFDITTPDSQFHIPYI